MNDIFLLLKIDLWSSFWKNWANKIIAGKPNLYNHCKTYTSDLMTFQHFLWARYGLLRTGGRLVGIIIGSLHQNIMEIHPTENRLWAQFFGMLHESLEIDLIIHILITYFRRYTAWFLYLNDVGMYLSLILSSAEDFRRGKSKMNIVLM